MRGPRRLIAILFAVALVGALAYPAFADALASKVNASRSNPLPIYSVADSIAQSSAQAQAAAHKPFHTSLSGLSGSCSAAGEVVGVGPSIDAIFEAFRRSPDHWRIITLPDWTSMGTGQATDENGTFYVSVVFCKGAGGDTTPPPPPPKQTTTTAASAPGQAVNATARKAPAPKPTIQRPLHPELRMQIVRLLPKPLTVCFGEEVHDVVTDPDRIATACPDVY